MALAAITFTTQDVQGNAVTADEVEIRSEISGAPLAPLFTDRAGLTPAGNSFAPAAPQWTVYAAEGRYRIDCRIGAAWSPPIRDYVALADVPGEEVIDPTVVAAGPTYDMLETDDIIYVNQTSGAPIQINLVSAVGRTRPVQIVDGKGDASTNPITIAADGAETILGSSTRVLNFDRASIKLYPNQDGSWFA